MEDSEVLMIKADVSEIKEAVKDVSAVVNDMRVLLAGNYITKQDFEEYKRLTEKSRRWWASFVIAVAGACAATVDIIGNIFNN